MKSIILTGADGFIGKNLSRFLKAKGYQVYLFSGDITSSTDRDTFIKSVPTLDLTYHFAGISSPSVCLNNKSLAEKVNITGALEFAKMIADRFPTSTFVFPSTGQVYANQTGEETEMLTEDSVISPVSFYAETKLKAELDLAKLAGKLNLIVLRLFNHSHKSQDPLFFLPSLYHQILAGNKSIVTGNLNLVRDFGAIQDLMQAMQLIAESNSTPSGVYNLCSGTGKTLKLMAIELASQMNAEVEWSVDQSLIRSGEPYSIIGSCKKLSSVTSWKPKFSKNEKELIQSFLKDLENLI